MILGDWDCRIKRSGEKALLSGRLNIRLEGEKAPNNRLPGNTLPTDYEVDLVCIWDPEFVTDGSWTMNAVHKMDGGPNDNMLVMHFR